MPVDIEKAQALLASVAGFTEGPWSWAPLDGGMVSRTLLIAHSDGIPHPQNRPIIAAAPTLHRELTVAVDELSAISEAVGLDHVMRTVDGDHVTAPEWTPILERVQDLRAAASAEADENRRQRGENAVLRHELGRLQSMLALDAPYAVHDVLTQLADAADHLDRDHNCDRDGWEVTRAAAESARRIVAALVGYKPPERDAEIERLRERARAADLMESAINGLRVFGESSTDAVARLVNDLLDAKTVVGGRIGEQPIVSVQNFAKERAEERAQAKTRDAEIEQLQARVAELEARLLTHTEATSPTGVGVVFGGPA